MAAKPKLEIKGSEELKEYMEMELLPSSFTQLKILEARQCDQELTKFLSILLPQSLVELIVADCELLEQVFDFGDLSPNKQGPPLFPRLRVMKLYGLPKMNCISNNDAKLVYLSKLEIIECCFLKGPLSTTLLKNLRVLNIESCKMIEQVVDEENEEMQVRFLHLKVLQLVSLPKLTKFISNMALSNPGRIQSFPMLTHLRVCRCNQLRYILPLYLIKNLPNLVNIEISDCEMLERVFGYEEDTRMRMSNNFVSLHQVRSLILEGLPKFSGCCQDGSTVKWFSLERVRVVKCPMVQKSSLGFIDKTLLTSVEVIECNTWANNEDAESNIVYLFKFPVSSRPLSNFSHTSLFGLPCQVIECNMKAMKQAQHGAMNNERSKEAMKQAQHGAMNNERSKEAMKQAQHGAMNNERSMEAMKQARQGAMNNERNMEAMKQARHRAMNNKRSMEL